ncbi:MAG: hypothetical protein ACOY82_14430 [Pseudomonadota bacterium]
MAPDPVADDIAAPLLAEIDRAHRAIETAEIELAAALEGHRFALAAAVAVLGPGLGLETAADADVRAEAQRSTPPFRGETLHRALGRAAAGLIAARRDLADARHRLAAARGAWRKARKA